MQEKIEELLIDWEIARQENRAVTPEELCADSPELLDLLRDQIKKLNHTSWLFDEADEPKQVNQLLAYPISTAQFWQSVSQHHLLTAEQIDSAKVQLATSTDSSELADHLVASQHITRYQADVLLGRNSGPVKLDRYLVLDEIEQGGMGEVYKAFHMSMKRTVAIKVLAEHSELSKQRRERFIREIESIAQLNHPNIVTAYDANEVDGKLFLAMEFVDGPNLTQRIISNGPISPADALTLTQQIAQAAQFAHDNEIIHRDIKPSNILLANQKQAKLLDLGIARSRTNQDSTKKGDTLTLEGGLFGTVAFMAPEQATNASGVDARADIYSLGCTLFYFLTGKPPFESSNPIEVIIAHRETPVADTLRQSNIPGALHNLLEKMLAKDVNSRYQSMDEVVSAIDAIEWNTNPGQITQHQSSPSSTNSRYLIIVALASLVALLVFASWAINPFQADTAPIANIDVTSSNYQNDLARLITGNGDYVVANTEFGQQEFAESSEVPQSPINIVQIQLDELTTDFNLGWLKDISSLRDLSINNSVLNSNDANFLGKLSSLRTLEIRDCESSPKLWTAVDQLKQLNTLSVQAPYHLDELITCIKDLEKLDHLAVTHIELSDKRAREILNATSLLSLDFTNTLVSGETFQTALRSGEIQQLVFSDTRVCDDDFLGLEPDSNLQILNLDFCDVGKRAVEFAAQLPSLREIYLEGTNVGDNELKRLKDCEKLELLDVANTNITRDGLKHLETLTSLSSLSIASTNIGDQDLQSFDKMDGLEYLNISGTNITDVGLKKLSSLGLLMLEITGCDLSDEAVSDFLERNPQCDVVEMYYETP